MSQRRRIEASLKARVVIEVLREEMTTAAISSKFGVHPNQISGWKKQALQGLPGLFSDARHKTELAQSEMINELYRQIGELKVERDFLKKKSEMLTSPRKSR